MVVRGVLVQVSIDKVVLWELEDQGKEHKDLACDLGRALREVFDLGLERAQEWLPVAGRGGSVAVVFGYIDGLDVVEDVGALDFLLVGAAVAKVVAGGEVAGVLGDELVLERLVEIGLADGELAGDFFLGEAGVDDAEEAVFYDLVDAMLVGTRWPE